VFQDFPLGTSDISLPLDSSASVDQRISIKEKRVNLSTVTTLETTIETADVFGLMNVMQLTGMGRGILKMAIKLKIYGQK
jgi:hypothetical protein